MKRVPAKTRGRPRLAESDERQTRERIVAAARKLFLRDGVEAVSMRNLASEVGCSPMALYRYFGSKQEILWQVWDVFLGELFARLERIQAPSPRERLERLAFAYLDYWLEHPERYLIVFLQKDLVPDATRNYLQSSPLVVRFQLLTRAVQDAQAQGLWADQDAGDIAQGLLCVLQGLALNFITLADYPWGDTTELSRQTVRAYLCGFAEPAAVSERVKRPARRG
ncbi:TetR/AcrR family transcriptional regulator [Panacagrimonas sp.]|uniref:TetR/AcrR family transcriptional regulator n=1 Tax=Panacagrimonas sp. TaxID=2480088 RepID=UPI003B51B77E